MKTKDFLNGLEKRLDIECFMRNRLCKVPFFFVLGVFVLAADAHSEIEWNPSISEAEKTIIIKEMEAFREKARKGYLEVSVGSDVASTWVGVLGRTNLTAYKPLRTQAFEIQLFDENGKEVRKTWCGRQFGETLKPDKKLLDGTFRLDPGVGWGRSRELLFNHGAGEGNMWNFNLVKAFKIEDSGPYRLQVTVRLFVKDTNGVFKPFILPPVSKEVKISDDDLK